MSTSTHQPTGGTSTERSVGLGALLPYLREHRGTLAVVGALSLVGAAASLAQPLQIGRAHV